jgi:hypothetical protein
MGLLHAFSRFLQDEKLNSIKRSADSSNLFFHILNTMYGPGGGGGGQRPFPVSLQLPIQPIATCAATLSNKNLFFPYFT